MIFNYLLNRLGAFAIYGAAFVVTFLLFVFLESVFPEIYYSEQGGFWLTLIAAVVIGGTYIIRKWKTSPRADIRKAVKTWQATDGIKSTRQVEPLSSEEISRLNKFRNLAVIMHYAVGDGVEFHLFTRWGNKVLRHELLFSKEDLVNNQLEQA